MDNYPISPNPKELKFTSFVIFLLSVFLFTTLYFWGITVPFFIGGILAFLLEPLISLLEKKRIKRTASVSIITFIVFLMIGLFSVFMIPELINQLSKFINNSKLDNHSEILYKVSSFLESYGIQISALEIQRQIQLQMISVAKHFLSSLANFFTASLHIIKTIFIILITFFYALKEKEQIKKIVYALIPNYKYDIIHTQIKNNIKQINLFIRGSIIVSLIIFMFLVVLLNVFDVHFANSLAVFSGVISIIPYIGPFIHVLTISFVQLLNNEPIISIAIVFFIQGIFYTIISFYIHPLVVGKSSHIHPFMIIVCVVVGGELDGVLGMLISIPIFIILKSTIITLFHKYRD